ncbi:MAG: hypothetical protein LR015_13695 [Verrucomicrobia bacterium]|nr:hypothetical protein [Verrucomicrobiota bacterium]
MTQWTLAAVLTISTTLDAARFTLTNDVDREAPLLAYNLGHFWPGSNTVDWWRHSGVAGARIFLTPAHFNVTGSARPGEELVLSESSLWNVARHCAQSSQHRFHQLAID